MVPGYKSENRTNKSEEDTTCILAMKLGQYCLNRVKDEALIQRLKDKKQDIETERLKHYEHKTELKDNSKNIIILDKQIRHDKQILRNKEKRHRNRTIKNTMNIILIWKTAVKI